MKVTRKFMDAFQYLIGIFGWTEAEQEEMKVWIRAAPEETVPYIESLAASWRRAEQGIT